MVRALYVAVGLLLIASSIARAQPGPAGPELRLSGSRPVRETELASRVDADAAGRFVVVWRAGIFDGIGEPSYGVQARRFDAAGTALGPEFEVNTTAPIDDTHPDVASDATGNFVVVWSTYQHDGHMSGIVARRYDAAGLPLSGEFQVNTWTTGGQVRPRVVRQPGGGFVVAWRDLVRGAFGQRFDANGVPQGSEFQANSSPAGFTFSQAVAIDSDAAGNFVIAWTDRNDGSNQDGSNDGVFARRFDAAAVPQGSDFLVNTYTTHRQNLPSVAMTPGGAFVVAFQDETQDGSGWGVFARRYDAAGVAQGPEFVLSAATVGSQFNPEVVADANGEFVVTWTSYPGIFDPGNVIGRRFDSSFAPLTGDFVVNTDTAGSHNYPSVALLPAGAFVVTWSSFNQFASNPYGWEVMGQVVTTTCGNGTLQPGEECDDAGTADGDGCSHACVVEACHACAGAPSTCAPIAACADGDGCCPAGCDGPTDDDCPLRISGSRLAIRETFFDFEQTSDLYRRTITLITKDPAVDTSPATGLDPATDGASLQVYNPATGDSVCFELEPVLSATWQALGQNPGAPRLLYTDRKHVNGACKLARIADGTLLKVVCKGTDDEDDTVPLFYSLDEPSQGSVAARFRSGNTEYCMVFGGTVTFDLQGRLFNARGAPAPAVCPVPPASCP